MYVRLLILAGLLAGSVEATEFKPYGDAQISFAQWRDYQGRVVDRFADGQKVFAEQQMVIYTDSDNTVQYAFTLAGHPAHPAWITRRVIEDSGGIDIEQIGYFAGEEPPFERLYRQYLHLNQRLKREIQAHVSSMSAEPGR